MKNSRNRVVTILVLGVIVVLSIPAVGQKARPQRRRPAAQDKQKEAEFQKLSKEADQARETGRLDDAIVLYNQALRLKPKWVEGWWYMGSIFYDRERNAEAREALRILLSIQEKNGPAWVLLGLCESRLRNYDNALGDIQRGVFLGLGGNKEFINVARYNGGILMTRAGQFELGFEALRDIAREGNESLSVIEALGLNILRMPLLPSEMPPDQREVVLLAGRAAFYQAVRRVEEAQRAFKELIARYPETPNAHYAYGVFLLIDMPDEGLEEFKRELQISPSHVEAMLQMVFEYLKRGDYDAALPYAEKAADLSPGMFAVHNALGRVLLEMGKVDDAIRELELGVKQAPDSPEMRFALARAYARAGRKQDAARERAKFLELDKQVRMTRGGAPSVGGVEAKPTDRNPPRL
jgi:tetratricopeptide (TPR) repeat protein